MMKNALITVVYLSIGMGCVTGYGARHPEFKTLVTSEDNNGAFLFLGGRMAGIDCSGAVAMSGLTHRVTMMAFERALVFHPEMANHHCVSTRLQWRRGEAHVFIDWCGGTIEYQPTELLVQAVRRVH